MKIKNYFSERDKKGYQNVPELAARTENGK
jgi:hypothetical protein